MNDFIMIVKEICDELNIKMTITSKDWMTILEKDNQKRFLLGTKFDLNSYALGSIFDDKYATYEMLKHFSIPVTEHQIIFSPTNESDFAMGCNTYEYAYDYLEKHDNNIVIKVNDGHQGKGVYHVTTKEGVKNVLDELFLNNYSLSLCPYYDIKSEYRVIMLDKEVELLFKKIKPIVIGDGIKTVKELLCEMNSHFFDYIDNDDLNYVLNCGEKYEYNWQFNLSKGATMTTDIDSCVKDKVVKLAKRVANTIDVCFASVDIVELETGEFLVLEINCGVATKHFREIHPNGYEITKNIYKKAIMKMFDL